MVLIESGVWRLWSDPAQGVQWMAAQVNHNGEWHDVVPDCRHLADTTPASDRPAPGQSLDAPLPAASFHMIPYSNRIRDGKFEFDNSTIQLDNAAGHAMHGALRKLPWKLISSDDNSMVCEFDSSQYASSGNTINWPWPISANITQQIDGDRLTSTIAITNHGSTAMPVGTGWHPYFVRDIGQSGPTLTLPVNGVFPDANGDCLPDGKAVELPAELDFRQARKLDSTQRIDCCLAGLSGACHIHWEAAGIELIMSASEDCRYLVLFNPDMPHFAIEPVTNANDAFNLASQGIESGTVTLDAGDTLSVSMQIQARLHS